MAHALALLAAATIAYAPATERQDTTDYFQQDVAYRIEASLEEATDVLHGRARVRYTNRAPVALDTIYFHQHLNAFRPNSAWARRELQFGKTRFQELGPREHAFSRLEWIRVDGQRVRPVYPHAPDSTVFYFLLPDPLQPGETIEINFAWDARLATEPRRQGRRGRHYDFAQWYPRIAVYDEHGWQEHVLLPQGEFYGEFARWDVTLEVAEDQVIGATGVPVEGDPGWERAAAPAVEEVEYRREAYDVGPAEQLGLFTEPVEEGRKRVRWIARDVHNFAWSVDPNFIYYQGRYEDVLLHALALPGDTAWDEVAIPRMKRALAWMDTIFGEYQYPQYTMLHRIESGGTEYPMLIMVGGAGLGLIVHETAHQYAHAQLANNEWREAWLDEGVASFVTTWFFEEHGRENAWRRTLLGLAKFARTHETQPVATPAAQFVDYQMYAVMSYSKGSVVLYMLREYLGEEVFRDVLHEYFERYKLRHVSEEDLLAVAEDVSGEKLDWFFEQWLHTTATLDYGIADVETMRMGNGLWRTHVEVLRLGEAWMPVTLQVGEETLVLESRERAQTVTVTTDERPEEVVLDPEWELFDIDRSNNREEL